MLLSSVNSLGLVALLGFTCFLDIDEFAAVILHVWALAQFEAKIQVLDFSLSLVFTLFVHLLFLVVWVSAVILSCSLLSVLAMFCLLLANPISLPSLHLVRYPSDLS